MRSQSISSLTSFIVTDAVATSDHLAVHTLAVLVSHSSYVHRPAARRVALEVAHEPLTISQHLHPRPFAHGSSIVITEELRAGLRRFVRFGTEYLSGTTWSCECKYVEDIPIDWPLTIELVRNAQAERGEWV